jgi:hypothetical protein
MHGRQDRREFGADGQPEHRARRARAEPFAERNRIFDENGNARALRAEHAVHTADDLVLETGVRRNVGARFERHREVKRRLYGRADPKIEREADRIEAGSEIGGRGGDGRDERTHVRHEPRTPRR